MGRGIRVVLYGCDSENGATLREAVSQQNGFVVAGESSDWPVCEALLDRYVPELLIANLRYVPEPYLATLASSAFPVLLGLGCDGGAHIRWTGIYDIVGAPLHPAGRA